MLPFCGYICRNAHVKKFLYTPVTLFFLFLQHVSIPPRDGNQSNFRVCFDMMEKYLYMCLVHVSECALVPKNSQNDVNRLGKYFRHEYIYLYGMDLCLFFFASPADLIRCRI